MHSLWELEAQPLYFSLLCREENCGVCVCACVCVRTRACEAKGWEGVGVERSIRLAMPLGLCLLGTCPKART